MADVTVARSRVEFKLCTGCNRTLPLTTEFFSRRGDRPIGFVSKCKDCKRAQHQGWMNNNREKQQAIQSRTYYRRQYGDGVVPKRMSPQYRQKTKEEILADHHRYLNKERNKETAKAWRKNNPDKVRQHRRKTRDNRLADPAKALTDRVRAAVGVSLRCKGREGKRRRSWPDLVGYDIQELMTHLERQFCKGMSWDNMGQWHVDHIVPISSFDFVSADDDEFKAAWALTNLRPIWAKDNQRKHAKRLYLL